jgi:hypothetical protein
MIAQDRVSESEAASDDEILYRQEDDVTSPGHESVEPQSPGISTSSIRHADNSDDARIHHEASHANEEDPTHSASQEPPNEVVSPEPLARGSTMMAKKFNKPGTYAELHRYRLTHVDPDKAVALESKLLQREQTSIQAVDAPKVPTKDVSANHASPPRNVQFAPNVEQSIPYSRNDSVQQNSWNAFPVLPAIPV